MIIQSPSVSITTGPQDKVTRTGKPPLNPIPADVELKSVGLSPPSSPNNEQAQLDDPTSPILLVEDNEVNGKVFLKALHKVTGGRTAQWARDGQAAVDAYKSRHESIKLIFMDIRMPVMTGNEAARLIREFEKKENITKPVTIIPLTAQETLTIDKACGMSVEETITKPFKVELVRAAVAKYVGPVRLDATS